MNEFYVEGLYAQKVSDITGVPVEYVIKMRDKQLLNESEVRNTLIRYDCNALLATKKFTERQIFERLAGIYNISVERVRAIIKMKLKRKIFYCIHCGVEISKSIYKTNLGMCGKCKDKTITL